MDWSEKAKQLAEHGFTPEGIEAFRVVQETVESREAIDKAKPKTPKAALDFGDWEA